MTHLAPSITGHTRIIAHLGVPTESFRSPMIYNPWFAVSGTDAVVVPMGCDAEDFAAFLRPLTRLRNFAGALITMPHKITVVEMLDEASPAVQICGACNALRLSGDGALIGDMFDGEGFVRGVIAKGRVVRGYTALVVGAGGVGSAIAASLAQAGVAHLGLSDADPDRAEQLAARIAMHFPDTHITTGSNDPHGWDIVTNATPLGMRPDDPMPFDPDRLSAETLVGEVVLSVAHTPLLRAAAARGCQVQIGTDMLFEQIPAYLEFFELPVATPDQLRHFAQIKD